MANVIELRLRVQDDGSAVVEKFSRSAKGALGEVETASSGTAGAFGAMGVSGRAAVGGLVDISAAAQRGSVSIGSLVAAGGLAAGSLAALAAGFGASVRSAAAFQDELNNVATLVDTTVVDMGAMATAVLAIDSALGPTGTNVKALYQAISAGAEPAQAVKLVGDAAEFAAASLTDTFTAVDLGTTVMATFGVTSEEAFRVLQGAVALGKTTGEQLGSSFGRIASQAASAGVELKSVAEAIAFVTANGVQTSETITGLSAVMAELTKPAESATKALRDMSGGAVDFSQLREALGKNGFIGLMEEVTKVTGGASEKLAQLFSSRETLNALAVYAKNMDAAREASERFQKTIEDQNLVHDAAAKTLDDLKSQYVGLKGDIDKFFIALGAGTEGPLLGLTKGLRDTVQAWTLWAAGADLATASARAFGGAAREARDASFAGSLFTFDSDQLKAQIADAKTAIAGLQEQADKIKAGGVGAVTMDLLGQGVIPQLSEAKARLVELESQLGRVEQGFSPIVPAAQGAAGALHDVGAAIVDIGTVTAATQAQLAQLDIADAIKAGDIDAVSAGFERLRAATTSGLSEGTDGAKKSIAELGAAATVAGRKIDDDLAKALADLGVAAAKTAAAAADLDFEDAINAKDLNAAIAAVTREMKALIDAEVLAGKSGEELRVAYDRISRDMGGKVRKAVEDTTKATVELAERMRDLEKASAQLDLVDALEARDVEAALKAIKREADLTVEGLVALRDAGDLTEEEFALAMENLSRETARKLEDTRDEFDQFSAFLEDFKDDVTSDFTRLFADAIDGGNLADLWTDTIESVWKSVVSNLVGKLVISPIVDIGTNIVGSLVSGLTNSLISGVTSSAVSGAASGATTGLGTQVLAGAGSLVGSAFGSEIIGGASSYLGTYGVAELGAAIADIGAASAAGASSTGLQTGTLLGSGISTGVSAGLAIAASVILEATTGVFSDLYGATAPDVEEKQAASIAKKLGKAFRKGEFAAELDAALQPFGVQLSGSLAKSIVQTPALLRDDVKDLIERNLSGETFGDIREAIPRLSTFAQPLTVPLHIEGIVDVEFSYPTQYTNTDFLVDDLKDIPVEEFLKVAFGLDIIDEIGAEAAGKVAEQAQNIGDTVAASQGLTGRRATQFADSMARGLLIMAEQAGITAEELGPFFDMLEQNTGADAVARMNEWGDQLNDMLAPDFAGQGQDGIQVWLDDLARGVAQIADVPLRRLLKADDLGELFRLSGLSAEEFARQIERVADQDPRIRAMIDAMDPPLIEVLNGAADEAERLALAVGEVFQAANENITGSLENLQGFIFNEAGALRVDTLRDRISALNDEIQRVQSSGGNASSLIFDRDQLLDELRGAEADLAQFNSTVVGNFQAMWQAINADGEVTREEAAGFIGAWNQVLAESGEGISDSTKNTMEGFFSWLHEEFGITEQQIIDMFSPEELAQLIADGRLAVEEAAGGKVDNDHKVMEGLPGAAESSKVLAENLGLTPEHAKALKEKLDEMNTSLGAGALSADELQAKLGEENGIAAAFAAIAGAAGTAGVDGTLAMGDFQGAADALNLILGDTVELGVDVGDEGKLGSDKFRDALRDGLSPQLSGIYEQLGDVLSLSRELQGIDFSGIGAGVGHSGIGVIVGDDGLGDKYGSAYSYDFTPSLFSDANPPPSLITFGRADASFPSAPSGLQAARDLGGSSRSAGGSDDLSAAVREMREAAGQMRATASLLATTARAVADGADPRRIARDVATAIVDLDALEARPDGRIRERDLRP